MRRTAWVLAAAASLLVAAAAPDAGAAVRSVSCTTRFDVPGADCRTVTVPLDRSGKVPGRVTLFTERIKSPKPSKSAIVLFPGGPGAAASTLGMDLKRDFGKSLEDHDLHGHFLLVPDVGHSVITSSACARRALRHFMASELIGECHRTAQHQPAPSKRVRSLQSLLDEALKDFPGLLRPAG